MPAGTTKPEQELVDLLVDLLDAEPAREMGCQVITSFRDPEPRS